MALSLLNTNEVQVARLVKALYNAAPGYTFMTNFSGYAAAKGMNGLAEGLVADFAANDNATLAAAVATNVGLTGAALTAATAYLQGQFQFYGAAKRGQVILDAVNGLSNLTADATYGAAATAFNDTIATSVSYSSNSSNNSTTLATLQAAIVPSGSTIALTSGTDNAVGTAYGDTFTGTMSSTLTDIDRVNGSTGNDTFKITLGAAGTVTPLAITDVETVRLTGATGAANNVLDVKYATGLTLLEFNDVTTTAGATHKIQGITSPSIPLQVKNATATTTTLNFTHDAAGLTGTADTVALTLQDNGTAAAYVAAVQVDTAGIEALNITSNGSGNYITSLATGGDVKTITINGAAPLTITTLTGSNSKLTTIDASTATGKISIDTATAASNLNITGGSANDTFKFGQTLDVNDTVNGGAGTDTIEVDATLATNVTLTNIETLSLLNGVDASLSQTNLAGITTLIGNADTNGEENAFTNATPGKQTLISLATDAGATVSYALRSTLDTSADTLTATVGSSSVDGTTRGILTANTVETLNLTSASKTATTANTLAQLNAQVATQVNLSGTALTLTAIDLAAEHTIDASAMTGVLTMNTTADDETIIGGSANDAITFDTYSELTSSDSIDGGAGNDTVTVATNGGSAAAYGRVNMKNVENLNLTIDVDSATSSTHTIDLRNAPVTTFKISTTGASAGNANTDNITVSNIQAGTTKIALAIAAEDMSTGTYTFDSDRNTSGNLVLTGAAGTNLNGTTIATTGDWTSFAIKQTSSASTDAHTLAFTAETPLTSLSVDATEAAMTFSSIVASKLATLTITGDNAVTVTALSQTTAALSNVNASASSGNITLTATTRTAAATVTTGVGDDSIELTLTTEGGNTIDAGSNSTVSSSSTGDTLVLNGRSTALTEIDLSSATDQIVTINGVANAATQVGFEHVDASGSTVVGGTYSIVGSSGINVITGDSGADTIDGAGGNDTITGNGGDDVLTGGSGNDVFDFNSVSLDGSDTITDFTTGYDSLDFDGILDGVTKAYQEVSSVAGNFTASNVFVIGGTTTITAAANAIATDADVVATAGLIVISNGVDTFIYHSDNLDGDGNETLLVTLAGVTDPTSLVTADFVFA